MEDIRKQQIELLETVCDYTGRLIPAMTDVVGELLGEKQDDTIDFLGQIIDALNFVLESFNVTMDLLNEEEKLIDKDELEASVQRLSTAMLDKNYEDAAKIMDSDFLPFLKTYQNRAAVLTA